MERARFEIVPTLGEQARPYAVGDFSLTSLLSHKGRGKGRAILPQGERKRREHDLKSCLHWASKLAPTWLHNLKLCLQVRTVETVPTKSIS
jgi:hypothetical protein